MEGRLGPAGGGGGGEEGRRVDPQHVFVFGRPPWSVKPRLIVPMSSVIFLAAGSSGLVDGPYSSLSDDTAWNRLTFCTRMQFLCKMLSYDYPP